VQTYVQTSDDKLSKPASGKDLAKLSRGIIIRVSGVRVPPPLLASFDANQRQTLTNPCSGKGLLFAPSRRSNDFGGISKSPLCGQPYRGCAAKESSSLSWRLAARATADGRWLQAASGQAH
jgi:hypothetical protein